MALILAKPDVRNVWSSLGSRADVDANTRLGGWVQEIPSHEVMNTVDYTQDLAIKYLFQEGFAEWDANFEYNLTSLTKFRGLVYQLRPEAEVPNKGKRPDISPESWTVAFEPYGGTNDLKELVRRMREEEGFLDLYVSKANPVMDGTAKAPKFQTAEGGYTFEGDNSLTGLYLNERNEPSIRVGGREVASFSATQIDVATSPPDTVLTVGIFSELIEQIQNMVCPIGNSIISARAENPSTYLGFGTWVLDVQGRALVGVSSSTSNSVPEWVKRPDSEFGEYTHQLTTDELPSNLQDGHEEESTYLRWLGWHQSLNRTGGYEQPVAAPTPIPLLNGKDVPHNNVQPSQTKYIWTRTG